MLENVLSSISQSNPGLWRAKGKAAGIHVAISGTIFLALLTVALVSWYPGFFFSTDGGWNGLRLVFAVDVVLGPLLTFVVFNPAKRWREKVIDLSAIALVQVAALIWGTWVVHKERPVALAEWEGIFHTVPASYLTQQAIDLDIVRAMSPSHPALIYVQEPDVTDEEAMREMFRMSVLYRIPPTAQLKLYRPLHEHVERAFRGRIALADLEHHADIVGELSRLEQKTRRVRAEMIFVPFSGAYRKGTLAFTTEGELLGLLPALPENDA